VAISRKWASVKSTWTTSSWTSGTDRRRVSQTTVAGLPAHFAVELWFDLGSRTESKIGRPRADFDNFVGHGRDRGAWRYVGDRLDCRMVVTMCLIKSRARIVVGVLSVVLVACGGDAEKASPSLDTASSAANTERSSAEQVLPTGDRISVLGWSAWPYGDLADGVASIGVDAQRPPSALWVQVCADPAADEVLGGVLAFTFGDAEGKPLESPWSQVIDPLVSPVLFTWPAAGTCDEGWVQPSLPVGVTPLTAVWSIDYDDTLPDLHWPLAEPYGASEHPVDAGPNGLVLDLGESHAVGGGASWTVFGVRRIAAAAPGDVVPADAAFGAGGSFEQPPPGTDWAVVDAEHCFSDSPGTFTEGLTLALNGWQTGVTLATQVNIDAKHLADDITGEACQRMEWVGIVPTAMTVTAVTSTSIDGPWWVVDASVQT